MPQPDGNIPITGAIMSIIARGVGAEHSVVHWGGGGGSRTCGVGIRVGRRERTIGPSNMMRGGQEGLNCQGGHRSPPLLPAHIPAADGGGT